MRWKPIKKLTDADVDLAWHRRLMVWNDCQGPYHLTDAAANGYFDADTVRRDGMWTKFLILPEAD